MRLKTKAYAGLALLVGVAALPPAAPAAATESHDLAAYPEMSPERTLPALAQALRDHLLDASSVTNFSACYPPVKVKFKDGKPIRWTVMFSLNAKNSYGGYTGLQQMAAVFYADRPVSIISTGMAPTQRFRSCPRVPDAEIRRLIEAE